MTANRRRRRAVELPTSEHAKNKKYGRRWKEISAQTLREAGYRCEIRFPGVCTGRADVCDHVDEAGPSTRANAQASCRSCNQLKGYLYRLERAGGEGKSPTAAELDGVTGNCATYWGGPHDLRPYDGPSECYGQPGHASRDW